MPLGVFADILVDAAAQVDAAGQTDDQRRQFKDAVGQDTPPRYRPA